MKYVIYSDGLCAIFSNSISHRDMNINPINNPVISAGFCRVETFRDNFDDVRAKVSCFGNSTSLGLGSRPEDENIIQSMFLSMNF